jgi:hypothetical protein
MSTININVSKVDMGLDQVDNTSDLNKPISTATQTALDNIDLQSVTDLGNTTTDNIEFTGGGVGVLFDNTSTLRKGTIDAGYGGAKGIAQVCAVGYELKWEAGRLYVMGDGGTTIREVSHNFTTTPSATDDNTKGFIVGSRWILDNGDLYICTDTTTATAVWVLQTIDASPTDGSTKAVSSNGVFDALALKQDILSGGTTNRLTKWSSSSAIGVSLIQDNGTTLSIGTTPVANNLVKVSSNSTDTTLVSENSQASGVGISGSSSGANGVGGSFTSTSVTGVKVGVNASATGAGGTNKGAVFGATGGATNYSIQLTDGTEGSGKFLKSVTANGEANWSSIANTDVSGLGTLATQSGTFSGTSSGTNTGDQIISDATITTSDITTNNFTTAKHGFVPKGTNVGNFLKDDGTWGTPASGGSGVCGIANSSGVYTYYATLSLAITAATSGQTVDILTNITETGSVTITTKTGVKINGNGYTYTLSVDDATNAITVDSYLVELFNWKVVRTGRANGSTGYVLRGLIGPVNLKCYNVVFENTYGYGVQFYGSIYGLTINTYSLCAYQQYDDLNLYNCNLTSTNLYGISTVRGEIFNSTVTALTDAIAIQSTSLVSNSVGRSTGSGVGISAPRVVNSTGISSSGTAISSTNGYNCVGISTSGVGLSGTFTNSTGISTSGYAGSGGTKTNCTLISSSNYGSFQENLNNTFLQSTTNVPLWLSTDKLVNSCTAICLWNNAGGHAINTTAAATGVDIRNCNLSVTNASAYCINGASGSTFKYASNTFKGSTTAVNSTNITQGITNLSDTKGNILI